MNGGLIEDRGNDRLLMFIIAFIPLISFLITLESIPHSRRAYVSGILLSDLIISLSYILIVAVLSQFRIGKLLSITLLSIPLSLSMFSYLTALDPVDKNIFIIEEIAVCVISLVMFGALCYASRTSS